MLYYVFSVSLEQSVFGLWIYDPQMALHSHYLHFQITSQVILPSYKWRSLKCAMLISHVKWKLTRKCSDWSQKALFLVAALFITWRCEYYVVYHVHTQLNGSHYSFVFFHSSHFFSSVIKNSLSIEPLSISFSRELLFALLKSYASV